MTAVLFSHFAVVIPVYVRDNGPVPRRMAHLLAPEVERHPQQDHGRRDACQCPVRVLVARFRHPRVRVEGEEEPKQSWPETGNEINLSLACLTDVGHRRRGRLTLESHHGERDFAGHRAVAVDDVDETDVCALGNGEVHCRKACQNPLARDSPPRSSQHNLQSPRPMVGHIQCSLCWMPTP